MRTDNSIKNVLVGFISNIIILLINFIAQKIFIGTFGIEYNGLSSVFSNIISMLSITELGIGTAIIYHLYKPVGENDIDGIKSLLKFYKKTYNIIALLILIIGLLIMPFLNFFIGENSITENIYFIYLFFLIDSVVSYLASYKRSLIYANQKDRLINFIHLIYSVVMNAIQIFILFKFKNYYLYLSIKVICRILENAAITIVANRLYPYIKENDCKPLDSEIKKDIEKKVKAKVFHSIGGYIVLGTDNILISKFFGLAISGIYGNYILIINAAKTVLSQIFSVVISSIGNLLIENNKEKNYFVYKRMNFINFIIYAVVSIVFFFAINDFVMIWLKDADFLFAKYIVLFLAINLFMQGMRSTMETFASAAGICYENRYVPIAEAVVNLIASIILLKIFGVVGVIIGTIISSCILFFYSYPKYIFKPLFDKNPKLYIKDFLFYFFVLTMIFLINLGINNFIVIDNILLSLIVKTMVTFTITTLILVIIFYKNESFIWFKNTFKEKLKKH